MAGEVADEGLKLWASGHALWSLYLPMKTLSSIMHPGLCLTVIKKLVNNRNYSLGT